MSFRRTFVTGLIIVMPVVVTYWLISLIFGAVDSSVTPVLTNIVSLVAPGPWMQWAWVNYISPLVSVIIAVAVVYLFGLVGGNVLGRQMLAWVEGLVMHVPVVRGIYSATRQFVDTFSRTDGKAFRSVVLVEFPREGCWSIGLVTGEPAAVVTAAAGRKLVTVFVPTSPNPTGGYVLFVPEDRALRLDMTVDDALKLVISGGVLLPGAENAVPVLDKHRAAG
jgi:uncharacterized membrane protein